MTERRFVPSKKSEPITSVFNAAVWSAAFVVCLAILPFINTEEKRGPEL